MFSSMDPSADITRFRTPLNWIERSRLFCYSVINLLCVVAFCSFTAKAFVFYHCFAHLSRTFFIFFTWDCLACQTQLVYSIISNLICQALFYSLLYFCQKKQKRIRRRRDLNPRTAWTVYTLSRGASSATWVLLHMPKYNKILNSPCKAAQRYIILANTLHIVKL